MAFMMESCPFAPGSDTSGVILLVLVLVFTKFGPQPRLYASMAWAALAMEIVGTQLGNWTWANEVMDWFPKHRLENSRASSTRFWLVYMHLYYCFGDLWNIYEYPHFWLVHSIVLAILDYFLIT